VRAVVAVEAVAAKRAVAVHTVVLTGAGPQRAHIPRQQRLLGGTRAEHRGRHDKVAHLAAQWARTPRVSAAVASLRPPVSNTRQAKDVVAARCVDHHRLCMSVAVPRLSLWLHPMAVHGEHAHKSPNRALRAWTGSRHTPQSSRWLATRASSVMAGPGWHTRMCARGEARYVSATRSSLLRTRGEGGSTTHLGSRPGCAGAGRRGGSWGTAHRAGSGSRRRTCTGRPCGTYKDAHGQGHGCRDTAHPPGSGPYAQTDTETPAVAAVQSRPSSESGRPGATALAGPLVYKKKHAGKRASAAHTHRAYGTGGTEAGLAGDHATLRRWRRRATEAPAAWAAAPAH
jgi:hypothetical protein